MPVMPRSYWPSLTAGIMASQDVFSISIVALRRSAISSIASYSQPIASPVFVSTNCRGG